MKYFGTDGIRQAAEKFTPDFAMAVVEGLVAYAGDDIKVLIGGDTRESTEWIIQDLATALETFGVEYSSVGVLPTPAINYCFYAMGFDFAIDVTASHNPYTDNGIKIFERGRTSGVKLTEAGCKEIERALDAGRAYEPVATSLREDIHDEAVELYTQHLVDYAAPVDLKGLRIGMDCADGATGVVGAKVFEQLGGEVQLIHAEAKYGTKINKDCGSTHTETLRELVVSGGLDVGAAFDGDGDRCMLVDENGDEVDGDQILAILAEYLGVRAIAVTVMANQGLLNWAEQSGVKTEITAVGDANVKAAMDMNGILLGGEQSGHIILPGEATGDGMLTALMVVKVMAETGKKLSELAGYMKKTPQVVVNLPATKEQKELLKSSEAARRVLLDYDSKLKDVGGRLLVRPSGTEALIRITMWGDDAEAIEGLAEELKNKLGEVL